MKERERQTEIRRQREREDFKQLGNYFKVYLL